MFESCSAPQPYCYTAENTQKAIKAYDLKKKLDSGLIEHLVRPIKHKI